MFFNYERDPMRVAVVSAHPDDETLGAGGTLARHSALGDEVHVCIVTCGPTDYSKERAHKQTSEALKCLGINNVSFLYYPSVKLNSVPGIDLNNSVAEFINQIKPQVVYAPSPGDLNSDHGIVARATAIASRPVSGKRMSLAFFETLSSTEWGRIYLRSDFKPNLYIDIAETLEHKKKAATCYKSELREYPHPRSIEGIETLAKMRGLEVGVAAAEAFMLNLHVA